MRVDASELNRFAQLRAGDGPVRELATRDFTRELLEELADARNYSVWRALQEVVKPNPDGELTALVAGGLASIAASFDWATRIRRREQGA
jgi:hypothetical protein